MNLLCGFCKRDNVVELAAPAKVDLTTMSIVYTHVCLNCKQLLAVGVGAPDSRIFVPALIEQTQEGK